MNHCSFVALAGLLLSLPSQAVTPDDEKPGNPFQSIVERNVFAIRPPPPPSEEKPVEPPPAIPPAKVVLTGILNILGPPRALLEVAENEPGKQPTTKKPILREGEREGAIEVLAIDIVKNIVRIRNGNIETNLTFEVAKQTGGAPAMAGVPPPPAFNMPAVGANTGAILPTTTHASTSSGRRSIVLSGAEPQPTTPMSGGYGNSGNSGMLAMNNFQRQPRTPQTPTEQKPVDPATQWIELKAHEQHAISQNKPFPPVPPVFNMDGDTGGGVPPPPQTGGGPPGLPPFPPPPTIPGFPQ